jgi:hypothetical protein
MMASGASRAEKVTAEEMDLLSLSDRALNLREVQ